MIDKGGTISQLRCTLVKGNVYGNTKMVRACNRHGMEADRVVHITCDQDIKVELLRTMHSESISTQAEATQGAWRNFALYSPTRRVRWFPIPTTVGGLWP